MNLKNKKIFVTGADGFIGSHLVERLLDENCQIKALVYYNSFNSWGWLDTFSKEKLKNIEVFAGDIRDPNGVKAAIKDVDVVFHLAALIGIPFSYHSPDSYIDTNIKGTLNVLQSCREYDIERVVIASTSEVYGTAQYVPIDEKHPFQGQSPYSASKIGADKIAESFYRSFSTCVIIARPFNTYGPRQSARAVIPPIITQLLCSIKKLPLCKTSSFASC
ncbi:MAG: SDR family NAD(P)-dependent oxidoreductase [Planctomycetes bacterium]|nr:SDR family NAD(P)-dependent oxidoreductase [Planctomycetota bacterium]